MTELKTIKDLNEDFLQKKGYEIFSPAAMKILKKEAIKWVKELSKSKGHIEFGRHSFSWDDSDKINWYTLAYRDVAKWTIMHLNNITEEDLR